jgi:hypothetical protein
MSRKITVSIRIVAIAAWVVAAVDALPVRWELDPDGSLFVVATACVASYAWIAGLHSRPAVEVYLAGKDVGRREALLEQQCEQVTRLSERRLTVVSGDGRPS